MGERRKSDSNADWGGGDGGNHLSGKKLFQLSLITKLPETIMLLCMQTHFRMTHRVQQRRRELCMIKSFKKSV